MCDSTSFCKSTKPNLEEVKPGENRETKKSGRSRRKDKRYSFSHSPVLGCITYNNLLFNLKHQNKDHKDYNMKVL